LLSEQPTVYRLLKNAARPDPVSDVLDQQSKSPPMKAGFVVT